MPDTPRFDPWLTAAEVVDLARTMVAPELPAPGVSHDDVPAGAMLAGTIAWTLYLAFAVSAVALAAGLSRSVVGAAGPTVVVLLVLPVVAEVFPAVRQWAPSTLVGAIVEMVDGRSATGSARAAAVSVGLSAGALWGSMRLLARREADSAEVRGRVFGEVLHAPLRAEEVRGALVIAPPLGRRGVDLHTADRIDLHASSLAGRPKDTLGAEEVGCKSDRRVLRRLRCWPWPEA